MRLRRSHLRPYDQSEKTYEKKTKKEKKRIHQNKIETIK